MDNLAKFCKKEKRNRCSAIMDRLRVDRENNETCDIVIKVENHSFNAHKCLLINVSDFFRKMLKGSFSEATKKEIELKDVSKNNFQFILDFIYGGTIEFETMSVETTYQVYHLADMLCLDSLMKECQRFMDNVDQFNNGVEWYPLAKKLDHLDAQKRLQALLFSRLIEESYRHSTNIFHRFLDHRLVSVNRIPYELLIDTLKLLKSPQVDTSYVLTSFVDLLGCVPLIKYRVEIILSWIEAHPNEVKDRYLALLDSIGIEALPDYIVQEILEKAANDGKHLTVELLSEVTKDTSLASSNLGKLQAFNDNNSSQ